MPLWRNTNTDFGLVAITLHWLVAIIVFGLFGLGLYMVDLPYYHPWYHKAPTLHETVGMGLFALMLLRLGWRLLNPTPAALGGRPWEHLAARLMVLALFLVIFALTVTGYLIPTADGLPLELFFGIKIPATLHYAHQEDVAGAIHTYLAWAVMGLAALHAAAAFKHHFIDKDRTLLRMLGQ